MYVKCPTMAHGKNGYCLIRLMLVAVMMVVFVIVILLLNNENCFLNYLAHLHVLVPFPRCPLMLVVQKMVCLLML